MKIIFTKIASPDEDRTTVKHRKPGPLGSLFDSFK